MVNFSKLHQVAISNYIGIYDLRSNKSNLFTAATKALSNFSPIDKASTAPNPIQIIDFFSGAGGTSLGFAAINEVIPMFHFLAGCDINSVSASTYGKNFGTPITRDDIIKIADTPGSIRNFLNRVGYDKTKPTILIGCAPCLGFSSHRKNNWDNVDDDRNNLVISFSKIVSEVNPAIFVMENVPEFLSNKYWKYFNQARKAFFAAGYCVKQNIYNAAEFCVPQERFRSFIIGMRKEFLLPKGPYSSAEFKTVRQAIESLRRFDHFRQANLTPKTRSTKQYHINIVPLK
jgi:DNA (cytosine-5)-methyltransferase 1